MHFRRHPMHIQHRRGSCLALFVHSHFRVGSLPRDLEANPTLPVQLGAPQRALGIFVMLMSCKQRSRAWKCLFCFLVFLSKRCLWLLFEVWNWTAAARIRQCRRVGWGLGRQPGDLACHFLWFWWDLRTRLSQSTWKFSVWGFVFLRVIKTLQHVSTFWAHNTSF